MLIDLGCVNKQKIPHKKAKLLISNAKMYANDEKQKILING